MFVCCTVILFVSGLSFCEIESAWGVSGVCGDWVGVGGERMVGLD